MPLTFEHVINLTTYVGNTQPTYVDSLMITNEPNNEINQFYIYRDTAKDKVAQLGASGYTGLTWSEQQARLTSQFVRRIGTKTFPQIGAMAFYSLLYEERSFLLCPVFVDEPRYNQPTLTVTQGANTLTFTMQSPEDIEYDCWRVIMRCGDTAFEYISYNDTLTVDYPYLSGTYDCYCIGYTGESTYVSADSNYVTITIQGTGEDPLDKFDYYSKHEIDAMKPSVLTVTLDADNWVGTAAPYSQTVVVPGIALTGYSYVASPAASCWGIYCAHGIYMSDPVAANSATFYAISDVPTTDLTVNILKMGVQT